MLPRCDELCITAPDKLGVGRAGNIEKVAGMESPTVEYT